MYIWVILATFLVALYSFNLSHRADIRSVEIEPLARAFLSKIIIKQDAATSYIRAHTPPSAVVQYPDGSSISSDYVTYSPGIIDKSDLQAANGASYLPYGYKDDDSVTSEIYCVDKDDTNLERACSDENAIRYVVTYMPVPQKWLNLKTKLPNNDLLTAMKELIGYNTSFGYPICKKYLEDTENGERFCDTVVLKNSDQYELLSEEELAGKSPIDLYPELPGYISKNGGFADTCNNPKKENLCLMYIYEYPTKY